MVVRQSTDVTGKLMIGGRGAQESDGVKMMPGSHGRSVTSRRRGIDGVRGLTAGGRADRWIPVTGRVDPLRSHRRREGVREQHRRLK